MVNVVVILRRPNDAVARPLENWDRGTAFQWT